MAFASDVHHAFTMNTYHAPSPFARLHDSSTIEKIRTATGVGGHQKYFHCEGIGSGNPSIFKGQSHVGAMVSTCPRRGGRTSPSTRLTTPPASKGGKLPGGWGPLSSSIRARELRIGGGWRHI